MKKLLLALIIAFGLVPCIRASDANVARPRGVTGYVEDTIRPKVKSFNDWVAWWKSPSAPAPRLYNSGDYKAPPGSMRYQEQELKKQAAKRLQQKVDAETKKQQRAQIAAEERAALEVAKREAQAQLPAGGFRELFEQARNSAFNIPQEKGFWQGFWPKVRGAFPEPVPSSKSMYPTVKPEVPIKKQSERLHDWFYGSQPSQSARLRAWFDAWWKGSQPSQPRRKQLTTPQEGMEYTRASIADQEAKEKARIAKKLQAEANKVALAAEKQAEKLAILGASPVALETAAVKLEAMNIEAEVKQEAANEAALIADGARQQAELASIEAARPSLRDQDIAALQKDYDRQQFYTKLADEYNKEQDKSWFTEGRYKSPEELEAYFMSKGGDNALRNERLNAYKQAYGMLSRDERKQALKQTSDMLLPWYKQWSTRLSNYFARAKPYDESLPEWEKENQRLEDEQEAKLQQRWAAEKAEWQAEQQQKWEDEKAAWAAAHPEEKSAAQKAEEEMLKRLDDLFMQKYNEFWHKK